MACILCHQQPIVICLSELKYIVCAGENDSVIELKFPFILHDPPFMFYLSKYQVTVTSINIYRCAVAGYNDIRYRYCGFDSLSTLAGIFLLL